MIVGTDDVMERKFASRRLSDNNTAASITAAGGGKKDVANNAGGRFVVGGGGGGGGGGGNNGRGRRSGRQDVVPVCAWSAPRQRGLCDKRLQASKQNVDYRSSNGHGSQVTEVGGRAEIGSASRPGGRKPSLNHLLNFTYGSRDSGGRGSYHRTGGATGNSIWTTRKHKYNKEQFLQANCQFVVREGEDYAAHTGDPDQLVNWESIEQVRIPGHEVPSCPICLYPPVAAKMTRCGHVYCWACMLHYLALSDKTWRKCPICYEAVHKGDLKSVVSLETACYRVGHPIRMQLMRRERGSVISLPSARWTEALETSGQLHVGVQGLDAAGDDACYAKLLVANRAQVLDVISHEENELNASLVCYEADLGPESCFVEDALQQLRIRREKLLEAEEAAVDDLDSAKVTETVVQYVCAFSDREEYEDSSEGKGRDATKGTDLDPSNTLDMTTFTGNANHVQSSYAILPAAPNPQQNQSQGHGKDTYYFYQAMDGQHIYMHSVNVAMLVREYGSLQHCPDVVSAPIIERETVSMNDDLRRRLRCLGHLPLTCQFELVELDFTMATAEHVVNVVSRDTLLAFRDEIKKRSQRRSRRAREENLRERQLHKEDRGTATPIRVPRLHLDSERQFPACGSDGGDGSSPSPTDELAMMPSPFPLGTRLDSPSGSAGSSAMSFAQMLRAGKAKSSDVRAVKSIVSGGGGTYNHEDESRDSDTGSPVPAFRDSFSAALWSALDDHQFGVRSGDEVDADPNGHHRCKKGKKKRLLFSTSVVRSK